jgi:hypothetical protein
MRERLVLLAAASVAFGASLGSGFHFDDYAMSTFFVHFGLTSHFSYKCKKVANASLI